MVFFFLESQVLLSTNGNLTQKVFLLSEDVLFNVNKGDRK